MNGTSFGQRKKKLWDNRNYSRIFYTYSRGANYFFYIGNNSKLGSFEILQRLSRFEYIVMWIYDDDEYTNGSNKKKMAWKKITMKNRNKNTT